MSQIRTLILSLLGTVDFRTLSERMDATQPAETLPEESTAERLDRFIGFIEGVAGEGVTASTPTPFQSRTGNTVPFTRVQRVTLPEGQTVGSALGIPGYEAASVAPRVSAKTPEERAEIWSQWPEDFRSLPILTLADAAAELNVDIQDLGRAKQAIFERVYEARVSAGLPVPARPVAVPTPKAAKDPAEDFDFRKLDLADLRNQMTALGEDPTSYGGRKRDLYFRIQELRAAQGVVAAMPEITEISAVETPAIEVEEITEEDFDAIASETVVAAPAVAPVVTVMSDQARAIADAKAVVEDDFFDTLPEETEEEPLAETVVIETPAPTTMNPFVTRTLIGGAVVGASSSNLAAAVAAAKSVDIEDLLKD